MGPCNSSLGDTCTTGIEPATRRGDNLNLMASYGIYHPKEHQALSTQKIPPPNIKHITYTLNGSYHMPFHPSIHRGFWGAVAKPWLLLKADGRYHSTNTKLILSSYYAPNRSRNYVVQCHT